MATPSTTVHHFHTPISLKLNDDNFLVWKQQVLATLRGLELTHFLDDSDVPSEFLPTQNNSKLENPAYRPYQKQDQLLVAWLLASMSASLLTKMVGLDSSVEIWQRLLTHYTSHTRAMIKKFRLLLKNPKNDRFVSTYANDIKKIADSLAVVGSRLSTAYHIDAILDGLSPDYDGFVTSILSRSDPYTVDELEALLLAQEERFEKHKLVQDPPPSG